MAANRQEAVMGEKIYKRMKNSGKVSVILGIVAIVSGVGVGVLAIINGVKLIKGKSDITF